LIPTIKKLTHSLDFLCPRKGSSVPTFSNLVSISHSKKFHHGNECKALLRGYYIYMIQSHCLRQYYIPHRKANKINSPAVDWVNWLMTGTGKLTMKVPTVIVFLLALLLLLLCRCQLVASVDCPNPENPNRTCIHNHPPNSHHAPAPSNSPAV
jgi:hypothetical protein